MRNIETRELSVEEISSVSGALGPAALFIAAFAANKLLEEVWKNPTDTIASHVLPSAVKTAANTVINTGGGRPK